MKYTLEHQNLVNYTKKKVIQFFEENPVPSHGIDHISRVVGWVLKIVNGEKSRSPFLCELAGWTHDIGRLNESKPGEMSREHHELSYQMLREWFREDREFDILTDEEKKELLYSVRYHWNNVADKYDTAWILRDADKLDGYGEVGLSRAREFIGEDGERWNTNLRHLYETSINIHTKTAQKLIKKHKLMEPVRKEYKRFLKSKIEEVEL